jgi:2-dehydropantoate 2-reductase
MQVFVVGAGAMGCLYGAALAAGGAGVTLVDTHAAHVEAINRDGLEVETRQGTARLPLSARLPNEAEGAADLILLFTKTYHGDAALEGVKHLIGERAHVLTLQNGLGNVERVSRHVQRGKVMVGVSTPSAELVGPGRIRSLGDGATRLYPAFSPETEFAAEVCRVLTGGGLPSQLEPNILEAIWARSVFNSAINPLCALTRRTPDFFQAREESRDLISTMIEEGVAAARASAILIDAAPIHALTEVAMADHPAYEPSMLQDIKAGRRTEIDAISGAIVEAAKRKGVATPVTETMWRLVKLEEAKQG